MKPKLASGLIVLAILTGYLAGSLFPVSKIEFGAYAEPQPLSTSTAETKELGELKTALNNAIKQQIAEQGTDQFLGKKGGPSGGSIVCGDFYLERLIERLARDLGETLSSQPCDVHKFILVGIWDFKVYESPSTGADKIVWHFTGDLIRYRVDENCEPWEVTTEISLGSEIIWGTAPKKPDWVLICERSFTKQVDFLVKWDKGCPCRNPSEPPEES